MTAANRWRLETVQDHGCDHEWEVETVFPDDQERHCLACGLVEQRWRPDDAGADDWTPWEEVQ